MADPVQQYLSLYGLTIRLAIQYRDSTDSAYRNAIQSDCSDGSISGIQGKCWMLQDQSGSVSGSLFNAMSYIDDAILGSQWTQEQTGLLKTLFGIFGFSYNGPGASYSGSVYGNGTKTDPVRDFLQLYKTTYRQAVEYVNSSDPIYQLSLKQECSDGTITLNGGMIYGKCWMLQETGRGSFHEALVYINNTGGDLTPNSPWGIAWETRLFALFDMFGFVYVGPGGGGSGNPPTSYIFTAASGQDFGLPGTYSSGNVPCFTTSFIMTISGATSYSAISNITFTSINYDFTGTTVTIDGLVLDSDYSVTLSTGVLTITILGNPALVDTTTYTITTLTPVVAYYISVTGGNI